MCKTGGSSLLLSLRLAQRPPRGDLRSVYETEKDLFGTVSISRSSVASRILSANRALMAIFMSFIYLFLPSPYIIIGHVTVGLPMFSLSRCNIFS